MHIYLREVLLIVYFAAFKSPSDEAFLNFLPAGAKDSPDHHLGGSLQSYLVFSRKSLFSEDKTKFSIFPAFFLQEGSD